MAKNVLWPLKHFLKGMKLRILMPIKYKSTPKEIVSAKLKQSYGSKIVHLFQHNDTTESSPKAIKDAKTWELQGAPLPWDPTRDPKASPWTYPTRDCSRYSLSGRYFNIFPRAPHPVATPLTGAIVQHIKDIYIGNGLQKRT